MQKKKIGLFGGTFDPVHNAHLNISQATIASLGLDEIWVLIDKDPLHKNPVASYEDRLEMLKIATENEPKIVVDRLEIQKNGTRYNIDVLKNFRRNYPSYDFWIILGMDVILNFKKWQNYQDFLKLTNFAIIHRPGSDISEFKTLVDDFEQANLKLAYQFIDFEMQETSSSRIRDARNEEHHKDLPIKVAKYIKDNNLY